MHALLRAAGLVAAAALCGAAAARAQDRWQVTLHSDSVYWDLELLALRGDTLLARRLDRGDTLRLPVMELDEVRLTLRDRAERLAVLAQLLAARPAPER